MNIIQERNPGTSNITVDSTPVNFKVNPPYPNPFNSITTILYQLPHYCYVEFVIFDINGRKIKILESDGKYAGNYKTSWNGRDEYGNNVGNGVYIYQFKAGNYINHGKILLLRWNFFDNI